MRWIVYTLLALIPASYQTVFSDIGCICASTKGATTTPGAGASISVGCSFKLDWTGTSSNWCLTDQTSSPCGTLETGFGYIDSCATTNFTSVSITPPILLEWDQTPTIFYTGQTINITWTTRNIGPDQPIRITYQGVNLRTLTSTALTGPGFFAIRLSDSNNAFTSGRVPINVYLNNWPSLWSPSSDIYQIIQSKLLTIVALDGTRLLGGGQNIVCDDRIITVMWRGLGQAQIGLASVSLNRNGGFGGSSTIGTALSNIPVSGNTTLSFLCPRTSTPSTQTSYAFSISVAEPGQNAYTGTSPTFNIIVAPTPSPTPTTTPTSTSTPSRTSTPSETPTQTPSMTPSTTETARPSIDYVGIAAAAAAAVDTTTPVIAGVVGTIVCMTSIGIGAYILNRKRMEQLRLQKRAMSTKFYLENQEKYFKTQTMNDPTLIVYGRATIPTKKASTPLSH